MRISVRGHGACFNGCTDEAIGASVCSHGGSTGLKKRPQHIIVALVASPDTLSPCAE